MIREITQYLDAQNTDIRNLKEVLLHLANERDILTAIITIIMLKRHASRHPDRTLPIIREMFYQAINNDFSGTFRYYGSITFEYLCKIILLIENYI